MKKQLFDPGTIVSTPGALALAEKNGLNLLTYLSRHMVGDWGDLSLSDKRENELSLKEGFRLFSAYETGHGKIWIITEADRSSTCLLLPSEY